MASNEKGTHLNYEDRKIIQTGIENGSTKTSIANTIGKDNSTVGKEIALHRTLKSKCPLPLDQRSFVASQFTMATLVDILCFQPEPELST